MKLRKIKGRAITIVAIAALSSVTAVVQEIHSDICVRTGFFTKDSIGNGIRNQATETGGLLVGYRYNISYWFSAEANYEYDRNTQLYSESVPARVQASVHQITGSVVVNLPAFQRVLPFVLGGGGALILDPTGNTGRQLCRRNARDQGTFLYGAGADYVFNKRLLLRVEYRGLVYKPAVSTAPA